MKWLKELTVAAVAALLVLAGGSGCKQTASMTQVDEVYLNAEKLCAQGQVDNAVALLDAALWDKSYQAFQADICGRMLTICLSSNQVASAQKKFTQVAQKDQQLAARCFGLIEAYLFEKKQHAELLKWCDILTKGLVPEGTLFFVADWNFKALRATGDKEAAQKILTAYAGKISSVSWRDLALRCGQALVQEKDLAAANGVLQFLDKQLATKPDLALARTILQVEIYAAEAKWSDASAYFRSCAGGATDQDCATVFGLLSEKLLQAGQSELLDSNSQFVLNKITGKPAVRDAAAERYMHTALQSENVPLALARIGELRKAGFTVTQAINWMDMLYAAAMKKGTADDFKTMATIGDELLAAIQDSRDRAALAGILLDVNFRIDRFAEAVKILEGGVPGQDQPWHDMMLNKTRAHLALQQGRKEEAVERFTRFMNESASKMEDTYDPITGDRITKEMVMGLNAKRVGDILDTLNKTADAAASYAQARTYYVEALKGVDNKSEQYQRLQAEMAAIPAPK